MGTDVRFVVEHKTHWDDNSEHWEMIGLHYPGRNSRFFEKLRDKGRYGAPVDLDYASKDIICEEGLFGQGWMPMEEFYELKRSESMLPPVWKKKLYPDLRVIWSFDN